MYKSSPARDVCASTTEKFTELRERTDRRTRAGTFENYENNAYSKHQLRNKRAKWTLRRIKQRKDTGNSDGSLLR
jgi:hypothetical protein